MSNKNKKVLLMGFIISLAVTVAYCGWIIVGLLMGLSTIVLIDDKLNIFGDEEEESEEEES